MSMNESRVQCCEAVHVPWGLVGSPQSPGHNTSNVAVVYQGKKKKNLKYACFTQLNP